MGKRVIVEPEAEADIAEAFDWYERQRPGLGDDFALCVEATIEAIGQRPDSFPQVRKMVRRALVHRFPYLVLFIQGHDTIAVIGVFHGRRDPKAWDERIG